MAEANEEHLYGLIEIAERQQNIAQMILEGLAKERAALGTELQNWSEQIGKIQEDIRSTVSSAISDALISVEDAGEAAATSAAGAMQTGLENVEAQIGQIEATLHAWARWLSWRWITLGLTITAVLAVLWWLASCAVLWWDTSAIGRAQTRKAQLMVEVAQLQSNRDAWASAGMVNKLTRCGPEKRPCIRVNERTGAFGEHGDYRVIEN